MPDSYLVSSYLIATVQKKQDNMWFEISISILLLTILTSSWSWIHDPFCMIMMLIFSSTRISWNTLILSINPSLKYTTSWKRGSWTQLQLDGNIVNKTIPIGISNFKGLSCFFIQKYLLKQWNYKKLHKFLVSLHLHYILKNVD